MKTQGMTSRALLLSAALLVVSIAPSAAQVGTTGAAELDGLQTKVDALKMPARAKLSLEAHLDVVDAVLSDGDAAAAMKELGVFAKEAGSDSGTALNDKQAAGLVQDARGLISLLGQRR